MKNDKIPSLHEWLVVGTSFDCGHQADSSFKNTLCDSDEYPSRPGTDEGYAAGVPARLQGALALETV